MVSPPPNGIDYVIATPLHIYDHFRSVFVPMVTYSALVSIACKLSQMALAKVGSPETGPPLVIAASIFCFKFDENNLRETYKWTTVATFTYFFTVNLFLPKNTSKLLLTPTRAVAIAVGLLTYISQTDPTTSSVTPAPLGFKAYMADPGVKARILGWKQCKVAKWLKLS